MGKHIGFISTRFAGTDGVTLETSNRIKEFIEKFSIDLLVPENVLTIPMHVPLGIAITELIAETQISAASWLYHMNQVTRGLNLPSISEKKPKSMVWIFGQKNHRESANGYIH